MCNKDQVIASINTIDYQLGCYAKQVDALSQKNLNKILDHLEFESTVIKINKNVYTIETVDHEKDITCLSVNEYKSRYGINSLTDH